MFTNNTSKSSEQLTDMLSQIIRVGYVTARQPEKHRVQVQCKDTVNAPLTTDWLLCLTPRASQDMQYDLPDIGDQVLCLFLPIGLEQGFVLGAMYGKQTPPVSNAEKTHRRFKDGSTIEYDRSAHKLDQQIKGMVETNATGDILIKSAGNITIQAAGVVTIQGNPVNIN